MKNMLMGTITMILLAGISAQAGNVIKCDIAAAGVGAESTRTWIATLPASKKAGLHELQKKYGDMQVTISMNRNAVAAIELLNTSDQKYLDVQGSGENLSVSAEVGGVPTTVDCSLQDEATR